MRGDFPRGLLERNGLVCVREQAVRVYSAVKIVDECFHAIACGDVAQKIRAALRLDVRALENELGHRCLPK